MTSTFMGLEIGKRSIQAHQQALATTGHNLANAETEGYSRQRVEFSAFEPIYVPGLNRAQTPGQIGQGVIIERIERIRDQLLDRRIIAESHLLGYWETRNKYVQDMENMRMVPGINSINSKMNTFWDGWQELAQRPADNENRIAVIERGRTLIDSINEQFRGLRTLQEQTNTEIEMRVLKINSLSGEIADLNGAITRIKGQGDNPNDLMDTRNRLLDELAKIIDISISEQDPNEFMVHTSGHVLIQGQIGRQFDLRKDTDVEGFAHTYWKDTGDHMSFTKGHLGSLFELRDITIEKEIQSLDSMAMSFTDLVNEIHREGYGANGKTGLNFFSEYPYVLNVNGNYDRSGDGVFDSTYIYRINGQNKLESQAMPGFEGVITLSAQDRTVEVNYYSTDTVQDIISRINNSGAEVVAHLNREGRLTLKATPSDLIDGQRVNPDFVIRHIEDSGYFLTGYAGILNASGEEGAYRWDQADAVTFFRGGAQDYAVAPVAHPSGWMGINPELLRDYSSVAAGFGFNGNPANPGNGDAAQAIASLKNTQVMIGKFATLDDYFADSVGRIGLLGEQAGRQLRSQSEIMQELYSKRQSVSGVNINEELIAMLRFNHGYQAAARYINTVNTLLDTLINRIGV